MEKNLVYDHTDKNGTEIYLDYNCPKCGGSGVIPYFYHVDSGTCFKCGGSGKREHPKQIKKYTPEYAAKLEAKRKERRRAKASEQNEKFFIREGFDHNGETYIVLGNTYKIREELKAAGCKYNDLLGWHSDTDLTDYPTHHISLHDTIVYEGNEYPILFENEFGEFYYRVEYLFFHQYLDKIRKEYTNTSKSKAGYFGEIGEKVDLTLKCVAYYGFDTQFGTTFIWKFVDSENHVFIWKTGKYIDNFESGVEMHIKGTIKDHNEYNGEQQTVLTCCKIT